MKSGTVRVLGDYVVKNRATIHVTFFKQGHYSTLQKKIREA